MIDYEKNTNAAMGRSLSQGALAESGLIDRPYLAMIENLADDAERSSALIEQFIGRCRGSQATGGDKPQLVPSGHFGQLDRLSGAIGQLSNLARELRSIG